MAVSAVAKLLSRTMWHRVNGPFSGQGLRTIFSSSVTLNHSPDYYAVLGLTKAATPEQVKLAYFKKAKKYHPDSNPTEEARWMFQLTAEAYEVLSDEKRRKSFDECGSGGFSFGGTAGGPPRPRDHKNYSAEELFSKIFGEAGKDDSGATIDFSDHASSHYGHDAGKEYKLNLSFEEAARGVEVQMDLSVKCVCPKCRGDKSELGYTWQVCVYCEGTGMETEKVGHVLTRRTCGYCNGTRQFIKYKCDECEGTGQTITISPQRLKIPPGCEHGQVMKVPIDQSIMKMTVAQDAFVYVYLTVEESSDFKRDDFDIFSEADVSISQTLLGGSIVVKGLHKEKLQIHVPAFTASHHSLVAQGEGIMRSDGLHKGNHYVKVGVVPPRVLSERQRLIWTEFAKLEALGGDGGTVNGVETSDSHKYEASAIAPSEISRKFNCKKKTVKDSSAEPERRDRFFANLWFS